MYKSVFLFRMHLAFIKFISLVNIAISFFGVGFVVCFVKMRTVIF